MPLPGHCSCYFCSKQYQYLLTKFLFPYMNQQEVVNHCYRLNGNLIFPHSKIFSALIIVCKLTSSAKQAWCLLTSGWYLLCCALVIKVCFTDFDDRDPSIGVNLTGPQTLNISSCDDLLNKYFGYQSTTQ